MTCTVCRLPDKLYGRQVAQTTTRQHVGHVSRTVDPFPGVPHTVSKPVLAQAFVTGPAVRTLHRDGLAWGSGRGLLRSGQRNVGWWRPSAADVCVTPRAAWLGVGCRRLVFPCRSVCDGRRADSPNPTCLAHSAGCARCSRFVMVSAAPSRRSLRVSHRSVVSAPSPHETVR